MADDTAAPTCPTCGHRHTIDGCVGDPTPSDRWAGVTPSACDCPGATDDTAAPTTGAPDFDRLETYVAEYVNDSPAALRARLTEAEFHVEQLRDALDAAERRAERIEARAVELATERDAALARIARAERLIDSWERDAPDHSNPVFIGRLRECLRRDPAPVRLRGEDERCVVCGRTASSHGGLCCFHKYDEQPTCDACAANEEPDCGTEANG